jgi:hypothetical protein
MAKHQMGSVLAAVLLTLVTVGLGRTQTPDESTPAAEEVCEKYKGEGARHGLCIAYCEAQDCDGAFRGDASCESLAQNFIDWSVKKGYAKGPSPRHTISCRPTACTPEDALYCRGEERDCTLDGECTAVCTSTFEGLNPDGKPLCSTIVKCGRCVSEVPKID